MRTLHGHLPSEAAKHLFHNRRTSEILKNPKQYSVVVRVWLCFFDVISVYCITHFLVFSNKWGEPIMGWIYPEEEEEGR